jgi:hypothetical protein
MSTSATFHGDRNLFLRLQLLLPCPCKYIWVPQPSGWGMPQPWKGWGTHNCRFKPRLGGIKAKFQQAKPRIGLRFVVVRCCLLRDCFCVRGLRFGFACSFLGGPHRQRRQKPLFLLSLGQMPLFCCRMNDIPLSLRISSLLYTMLCAVMISCSIIGREAGSGELML